MYIDVAQQIGWKETRNGRLIKQVFNLDKVYLLDDAGNRIEYLGHCYRTDGSFFPHRDLTDDERRALVDALNAYRAEYGLEPLQRFNSRPLTIAEVHKLLEPFTKVSGNEEGDADD